MTEDFEASLRGKYFAGKKYEAGSIEFPLVDFWNDYERGAVDFTLKWDRDKDEAFFKVFRNFGHHQFSDGWHSRDYTNGGILRFTTHRIPNNELTAGIEAMNIGGKSYSWPAGEWKKNEIAFFIQDEFVFKKKFIFSTGIRFNSLQHESTRKCRVGRFSRGAMPVDREVGRGDSQHSESA